MSITLDEVRKIAQLARIKLTPDEERRHAETISVVLDYMKILNEVDINGVEITCQVTGLKNITREDVVLDCGFKKELIEIMPVVELNELQVPAIFE
jgi:aspartyl-tRNA(Asn)/glutamyl-tRNA(Gln) amidotransferase subunit C